MSIYSEIQKTLIESPKRWTLTGVAGFIGSNLLEDLLQLGQFVVGVDDFSTGHQENLDDVEKCVGSEAWGRFSFIKGDIAELEVCCRACRGADYVLHQAALGSVPRSITDPLRSNRANIDGFLNMLVAARDEGVRRFVYASSSSVYGDDAGEPKKEEIIGRQLSPYAVTKRANELYAAVFSAIYKMEIVGLRYFNVFGPRQDPYGAYAAVVPKWLNAMWRGQQCTIYGDGETSRDFCYVKNAVQANILAALAERACEGAAIYNIAVGEKTSLNLLHRRLSLLVARERGGIESLEPLYAPFRPGDIRHSLADTSRARCSLGYLPSHRIEEGLEELVHWFSLRQGQS